SRAIYGMPMFATLSASNIAATVAWYTEGLDFVELFAMPGPAGDPILVHLRRWQFQDLLVRPADEPVTPASGCALSFAAVYDEIDSLAERARTYLDKSPGAACADGPVDTAWNTRDLTTTDPDGNTVVFTAARPPDLADSAFSARMLQRADPAGD